MANKLDIILDCQLTHRRNDANRVYCQITGLTFELTGLAGRINEYREVTSDTSQFTPLDCQRSKLIEDIIKQQWTDVRCQFPLNSQIYNCTYIIR